jgi:transcriptional regulator with XRE-family HTH domain
MSDISQIDGQSVRLKRESLGWAISDMATMACLSTKQIKQIEEGGMTAFYSENVKLTSARKVAGLLGMTEPQLFGQVTPAVIEQPQPLHADESLDETDAAVHHEPAHDSSPTSETAAISRSESWHFLAQPPENIHQNEQGHQPDSPDPQFEQTAPLTTDTTPLQEPASEAAQAQEQAPPETSNTNYLVKILALFLVALAAAALLRQQAGDDNAQTAPAIDAQPVLIPVPEAPPATTLSAPEPSGNAAQATATSSDATAVLPAPGPDNTQTNANDPVGKPLPAGSDTPAAIGSK